MTQAQPVAPLTIIAIFAGIIEASALATLPFLSESSQTLYTWFLVGFPFFLTALFFLTLNFNYKSFYSPSPDRMSYDNTQPTNTVATPAMASAAREGVQGEPVTFMFSGPDANRMMEQQVLSALAHPPYRREPGAFATWTDANVRNCRSVHLRAMS